jgi:pimeloyl-ACP methyl ester carboxylesterase
MRARAPDASGFVDREGVQIFFELYGDGELTVLLLPAWSIVRSRVWKAQIPFLARHFRVVTFDGRGCGRSSRPPGATAYTPDEYATDTLAVLDATGTDRAVLVGLSAGGLWGVQVAAEHPARVVGLVAISPAVPLVPGHPERTAVPFDDPLESTTGWAKQNSHYWQHHYADFVEFFFGRVFTEAHSTKPIEDGVGWALEVDPETLADTYRGIGLTDAERFRALCAQVCCPVLVIHGDEDAARPHAAGAALAAVTGGTLVTIAGGGHAPNARDPVLVNRLIREFVRSVMIGAGSR